VACLQNGKIERSAKCRLDRDWQGIEPRGRSPVRDLAFIEQQRGDDDERGAVVGMIAEVHLGNASGSKIAVMELFISSTSTAWRAYHQERSGELPKRDSWAAAERARRHEEDGDDTMPVT